MKTAFFDIEAGGLKGEFDQVYCAAFKEYGKEPYVLSRGYGETNDKRLCIEIKKELKEYDIIITYYGLGYDKPFINSRLAKHRLKPLERQLHIDCYRLAKKIFHYALNSKRLVAICELLGIEGKTRVEPDLWEKMKYASRVEKKKSLNEIIEHCLWDVKTLELAFDLCFKHAIVSVSLA
jgi:uncharacterized protein YprB with RNaseH-like and TPR domain